jgi:acyl dehydratase
VPAIGPGLVGHALDPVEWTWTDRDVMLYALGIGARVPEDLPFLYEGLGPRVAAPFPLAATTLALLPLIDALGIDPRALLHASQAIDLHRAPEAAGRAVVTRRITGVWDKGRAAIVDVEDTIVDAAGPLATARSAWWIEGAGGFGGDRSGRSRVPVPAAVPEDRAPDLTHVLATSAEQAALHRLSGDRNPVHIDPEMARAAGQPRPFLHGLCTLGVLGLVLDKAGRGRLTSLTGRFVRPVFPGDVLEVEVWWVGGVGGGDGGVGGGAVARVRVGGEVVVGAAGGTFGSA